MSPAAARPSPLAARWRRQVRARLGEIARLRERAGLDGALWSGARARRYGREVGLAGRGDPLLDVLLAGSGRTFLDVGAGAGRHAVPLARRGHRVVALEPSATMREELLRAAGRASARIRLVDSPWPAREGDVAADVAYSANVLFVVEDAPAFLAAMTRAAARCHLLLSALHFDAVTDPLWRHFHGRTRRPSPTYLDVLALLREQGHRPEVRVVKVRPQRQRSLAAAAAFYRESLCLPDDPATARELRRVLAEWLVRRSGGYEPPAAATPALISWRGDRAGRREG